MAVIKKSITLKQENYEYLKSLELHTNNKRLSTQINALIEKSIKDEKKIFEELDSIFSEKEKLLIVKIVGTLDRNNLSKKEVISSLLYHKHTNKDDNICDDIIEKINGLNEFFLGYLYQYH